MTLPAEKRPDENDFAEQVLRRVAKVEKKRRWSSRVRFLVPIVVMAVVVGAWSNAFFDGTLVLHWLIQVLAWVTVVATVEAHLTTVLLGPFAPLPTVISLFLLLAALAWVRAHQPDPPECEP